MSNDVGNLETRDTIVEAIDDLEGGITGLLQALSSSDPDQILNASQYLHEKAVDMGKESPANPLLANSDHDKMTKKLEFLRGQLRQTWLIAQTAYNHNEAFLGALMTGAVQQKTYSQNGLVKANSDSKTIASA